MSDLLKEAIADAKAVRETALQNAKMALEEAFTPQLKSMLSAKLKEDEFEDEEDVVAEPEMGDEEEIPEVPAEEGYYEDEEFGEEEPEVAMDEPALDDEIPAGDDEMEEEGYKLDLEDIIRELEHELAEEEMYESKDDETVEESNDEETVEESNDDETVEESSDDSEETVTEADDEDEDDEPVEEEVDQSSGIGKGTGKGNTDRSSGIGTTGKAKFKEEYEAMSAELNEHKEAVKFLKDKLHEVNILNAKLLFTNKLFKEFTLNNNQKLKVVETFDRAQTTREIKLVYSTLAESFGDNGSIKRKSISESASASVGSTKPSKESTKVITEEVQVVDRFKKLAGLING